MTYRVPMIFPGQGSQFVGMASDLVSHAGAAGEFLGAVDDVLGFPLVATMTDGPADILTETRNAQPAILAHSVAVLMALRELGIEPSVVAGHSLGEFSAAVAAGALDPADGLKTVRKRGELMFRAGETVPGTMAAVMGLDGPQVREICARVNDEVGVVVLANHNSENQVAISGEVDAVAAAGKALTEAGARRVIPLNVSGAFHSPLLEDAARQFKEFLNTVEVSDSRVPLIANVSAKPQTSAAALSAGFGTQLTSPVLWHGTMKFLCGNPETAPRVVLEVGPGKVLSNLAKRAFPDIKFHPVGTGADLEAVCEFLDENGPQGRQEAG